MILEFTGFQLALLGTLMLLGAFFIAAILAQFVDRTWTNSAYRLKRKREAKKFWRDLKKHSLDQYRVIGSLIHLLIETSTPDLDFKGHRALEKDLKLLVKELQEKGRDVGSSNPSELEAQLEETLGDSNLYWLVKAQALEDSDMAREIEREWLDEAR